MANLKTANHMEASLRIVFAGEVLEGFDHAEVRQAAATRFGVTGDALERLFSGQQVILKKGLTEATGQRYVALLERFGMRARLIPTRNSVPQEARPAPPKDNFDPEQTQIVRANDLRACAIPGVLTPDDNEPPQHAPPATASDVSAQEPTDVSPPFPAPNATAEVAHTAGSGELGATADSGSSSLTINVASATEEQHQAILHSPQAPVPEISLAEPRNDQAPPAPPEDDFDPEQTQIAGADILRAYAIPGTSTPSREEPPEHAPNPATPDASVQEPTDTLQASPASDNSTEVALATGEPTTTAGSDNSGTTIDIASVTPEPHQAIPQSPPTPAPETLLTKSGRGNLGANTIHPAICRFAFWAGAICVSSLAGWFYLNAN